MNSLPISVVVFFVSVFAIAPELTNNGFMSEIFCLRSAMKATAFSQSSLMLSVVSAFGRIPFCWFSVFVVTRP